MLRRQIIALVAKIIIILKCSRIIEYWTNLQIIFAIIAFDDIILIFIHLIKLTFVKMSLNYYSDNILRFSYQKKK